MEQPLARYNAFGPSVLTPALLDRLRERQTHPPEDSGVWTAKKAAAFMATQLCRLVAEQRGWEALRAIGRIIFSFSTE